MEQELHDKEKNSLPPRNTIHKAKEKPQKSKTKWNGLHLIVTAFILLIVSTAGYFLLNPEKEVQKEGIPIKTPDFEVTAASKNSNDIEDHNSKKDSLNVSESIEKESNQIDVQENNSVINDEDDSNLNSDQLIEEVHEIKAGENLYRISLKYYHSGEYVNALAKYNGLAEPGDIHVGLKLVIPSKELLQQ